MNIIEAKNVVKSFHNGETELTVLRGLSFSVKKGEFVAVTGKSGSGKSTLLYQLGLLDKPTGGEIIIDGVDVNTLSNNVRTQFRLEKLGYVFQDYALLADLTALENIMVTLLMQGIPKKEAKKKAMKVLQKVGLGDKPNNLPSQLSGGQQQRVSIARAIGHDPKIVFADEPTANLDTETAKMVLETFIELNKEGQTIVMVTHEKEYANLTDRTVTLSDGVIVSDVINKK